MSVLQPVLTENKRVKYDTYGMFSRNPLHFTDSAYSLKRDRKNNKVWIAGNGLVDSLLNNEGTFNKACVM